jgi:hypothetical protein
MVRKIDKAIRNKKAENEEYDINLLFDAYRDENRRRIIEYLKSKREGEEENTINSIQEYINFTYKSNLSYKTVYEHCGILTKSRLVFMVKVIIDLKPTNIYFIGENQKKRIDKIDEILKPSDKELEKKEIKSIINLLKEDEIMMTSTRFMKNIPDGGWMDICFPSESVMFVTGLSSYSEGYREMKEKGIRIRVITEFTSDNIEFCLKMVRENMVDEIRHLKHIRCGFAVSENQYMAAFLPDSTQRNNSRFMTNAIYSEENTMIEYGQALFDTCWENSIEMFKNHTK